MLSSRKNKVLDKVDRDAKAHEIQMVGEEIYHLLDIKQQNLMTAVKAVLADRHLIEQALQAVQIFGDKKVQQPLVKLYQPQLIPKESIAINQHRFESTLSHAFSARERSKFQYHTACLLSPDFATAGLREAMILCAVILTLQHVSIVKFNQPEVSDDERFALMERLRSVEVFRGRLHELAPLLQTVTSNIYKQNDHQRDLHYYRKINQQHPFNKYILPALIITVGIIGLGALSVGALATYGIVPAVMLIVGFAVGASFMAGGGLGLAKKIVDWVRIKSQAALFDEPAVRGTHARLIPEVGAYQSVIHDDAEKGCDVSEIQAIAPSEPERRVTSSPLLHPDSPKL
jgi:hypothetical protein